eukprot:scaffold17800_cov81-Attheya_sp.AAC.1
MAANRVENIVRRRAAATDGPSPNKAGLPLTSSSSMPTSRPTIMRSRNLKVFIVFQTFLLVFFVAKQQQQQLVIISFGGDAIKGGKDPTPRELTLNDLIVGDFIAAGGVNVACDVKFPDWWYTQQQNQHHNTFERKVLKLTTDIDQGCYEVDSLRKLNEDKATAHRLNFIPILFWAKNVKNPFYKNATKQLPESFPHEGVAKRLTEHSRIVAHVVPYVDEDMYIYKLDISTVGSVGNIRIFFRSLVEQLAHAYSYGIVNFDLSTSNVWADPTDYKAVVTDWNGGWDEGELAWSGDANFRYVPPEALVELSVPPDGRPIMLVSASAYDVWSIGVKAVTAMYYPCFSIKPGLFDTKTDFLRAILQAIGGNMDIPVSNATDLVDLAALVGLDSQKVSASEFQPMIYQHHPGGKCTISSFKAFEQEKEEGREGEAFDFIRSIQKVSPLDRPKYEELIQHPFLKL